MIIFKIFPNIDAVNDFKNAILSKTDSCDGCRSRASGLYAKISKHTVTIRDVENNASLRGENFNIAFYGIILSWLSKKFLIGWIGPSFIYTALTILIVMLPFEYLEFRYIALIVWVVVYLTSSKRIVRLKGLIHQPLDS